MMEKDRLVERLMATFVVELAEHVEAMGRDLLGVERARDPAERVAALREVLRRAHSLKGASRAVSAPLLGRVCHLLEELLGREPEGGAKLGSGPGGKGPHGEAPLAPDVLDLALAVVDALGDAGRVLEAKGDLATSRLSVVLPRLEDAVARAAVTPEPEKVAPAPVPPSAQEPAPRTLDAAPPRPSPHATDGQVRVPAEKLDAILARSAELLLARRQLDLHATELELLGDRLRRWVADWSGLDRSLGLVLDAGVQNVERAGHRGNRRGPKRARDAAKAVPQQVRALAKDLELVHRRFSATRERIDRAAADLDGDVRRARMLPLSTACLGLDRMVRDLAKAGGKRAELRIEGADVELDRAVLEALKDPLAHLVRNAVDHGIEPGPERTALGKSPEGFIVVSTSLRHGMIEISVTDDGRGIDVEAVRRRARAQKLPEATNDAEAARFVFAHGISTSTSVTETSGRGVGLDVVKSRVEALHGSVDVESHHGFGTRFVLTAPTAITTLRSVLVGVAGQTFAIPAGNVVGMARVATNELRVIDGCELFAFADGLVPVASLAQILGLRVEEPARPGAKHLLVVLSTGALRAAIAVDELLAEQEVAVKSLGARLGGLPHLAGATVLGDGRLAFLLSPAEILQTALEVPLHPLAPTLETSGPVRRLRVILADDSLTTRTLEKTVLESAGYDVDIAADGLEAWELLERDGADIVVADVEMPRMTGFELTARIRASKRFRDVPIVLVTSRESDDYKKRGLDLGADAYLVKSAFEREALLGAVAALV